MLLLLDVLSDSRYWICSVASHWQYKQLGYLCNFYGALERDTGFFEKIIAIIKLPRGLIDISFHDKGIPISICH